MDRTEMKRVNVKAQKTGLELIEEATHLLRTSPAATLATYYLGAIPFILGLLYFWADMSRSPYASQYLAEASLVTAVLFIWMKFCQALFAQRLRAQLAGEPVRRYGLRQCLQVLFAQAVVQPSGLFIIPIALVLTVPFGWAYAFYQNVTALGGSDYRGTSKLMRRAWKQTLLWPGQNHIILAITALFGVCVLLNWAVVAFSVPSLLKMLFGIEGVFTRSPVSMLNTTFFAAMFCLTYLTMDPLLKTVYALRCFYGESLQSGEDLKADLRRFAASPQHFATMILMVILLGCGSVASMAQSRPTVTAAELNHRIDEVIHERRYAWRMPRDTVAEKQEEGVITKFFSKIGALARNALRAVVEWIVELVRKSVDSIAGAEGSPAGWTSSLLLYGLLAAVLSGLAVFVLRVWRRRHLPAVAVQAEAIHRLPDVRDENVAADQLPEDGWMKLAREFVERGELRLAMRAFYLASLAHLAHRNLISIARSKSNRDYENELRRRGHSIPELLPVFGQNLSLFERIWYGMHEVNEELVRRFAGNVEKIRAAV
jgi:hypothetical protein